MAEELNPGCGRPTATSVEEPDGEVIVPGNERKEEHVILIGWKAPDFTAPGYHKGKFVSVKLSEYLGKWVLLCFYPGDFTFV